MNTKSLKWLQLLSPGAKRFSVQSACSAYNQSSTKYSKAVCTSSISGKTESLQLPQIDQICNVWDAQQQTKDCRHYSVFTVTFLEARRRRLAYLFLDLEISFIAKLYCGCSRQSKCPESLPFCIFAISVLPVLPVSLRECTNTIAWCPFLILSST